jgi:hypothetical protein
MKGQLMESSFNSSCDWNKDCGLHTDTCVTLGMAVIKIKLTNHTKSAVLTSIIHPILVGRFLLYQAIAAPNSNKNVGSKTISTSRSGDLSLLRP